MSVAVPITPVIRTMLVAIIVLHVLNLFAQRIALLPEASDAAIHFKRLFTVNTEGKVPTWYSASALLFCAGLLMMIGIFRQSTVDRWKWILLSAVFAFISMDEASGFHDEMSVYLHEMMPTEGALYNTWVIPAGLFVAGLALWMRRFFFSLPRRTLAMFALSGALYVGGALGMEMVGSAYVTSHEFNRQTTTYSLMATIEELMEMSGVIVFAYALLSYMHRERIHIRIDRLILGRAAAILGGAVALLFAAGMFGQVMNHVFGHGRLLGFVRIFHLDGEGNAGAWFSSMLLLFAAALCAGCTMCTARAAGRRMWRILAFALALCSLDEFASLHELTIVPMRDALQTDGILYFPWVLIGGAVAAAVGLSCLKDFRRLPLGLYRTIMLSGVIYITGALGVELIGAWWSSTHGELNMGYEMIVAVEELLELIGAALFTVCVANVLQQTGVRFHAWEKPQTLQLAPIRFMPAGDRRAA